MRKVKKPLYRRYTTVIIFGIVLFFTSCEKEDNVKHCWECETRTGYKPQGCEMTGAEFTEFWTGVLGNSRESLQKCRIEQ